MLIAFEGIDGSGKSTHSNLLATYLEKAGYPVFHTRPEDNEDTQTIATSKIMTTIKAITHNPAFSGVLGPETELFLYLAQLSQLTSELIEPALATGKIVVSDRFTSSLYAYFHYGKGISTDLLQSLLSYASHGHTPDITIYTDKPATEAFAGKARSHKPLGRKELLGPKFFERVRQGFLELAKTDKTHWLVINTMNTSTDDAQALIRKKVEAIISTNHPTPKTAWPT